MKINALSRFALLSATFLALNAPSPEAEAQTRHLRGGAAPQPVPGAPQYASGGYWYDVFSASKRMGRPERVSRQVVRGGRFVNEFEARIRYDASGNPDRVTYRDSGDSEVRHRMHLQHDAAGRMTQMISETPDGNGGLIATAREDYAYDTRGARTKLDYLYRDTLTGQLRLEGGRHWHRTYDAQGRVTVQTDSSFNGVTRRFDMAYRHEYDYTGQDSVPATITTSDERGPLHRLTGLRWGSYARDWMDMAVYETWDGAAWRPVARYAGTGTADVYVQDWYSRDRSNPGGPLVLTEREQTVYNPEGDLTYNRMELAVTGPLEHFAGDRYDYEYDGPAGAISRRTWYRLEADGSETPLERFLYFYAPVTAARPTDLSEVRLSPNPASGRVRITAPARTSGQVLDLHGKPKAWFYIKATGFADVDLDGLAPGFYTVRIAGLANRRLVVR